MRSHGLEHAKLPCPSPSPRVCSNSCPLSRWCHPTFSSVIPFSSCLQSFPASGSFLMSWLFASHGQSTWASASFSINPSKQCSGLIAFRSDWFDLLAVHRTPKSLFSTTVQKHQFFSAQPSLWSIHTRLSHLYMTVGKTIALTIWTFVGKVMSLLFNVLSRLVIAFLTRSKCLLISWLQSPSAVILEPKKIKSITFCCFPIYLPWSDGTGCHDLHFLNVGF